MSYPGWGFLVVLGVAIGSAIYYYFHNDGSPYERAHDSQGRGGGFRADLHGENCTICLDRLDTIRKVRMLRCGHTFHDNCIRMWLNQKKLCPICRITI